MILDTAWTRLECFQRCQAPPSAPPLVIVLMYIVASGYCLSRSCPVGGIVWFGLTPTDWKLEEGTFAQPAPNSEYYICTRPSGALAVSCLCCGGSPKVAPSPGPSTVLLLYPLPHNYRVPSPAEPLLSRVLATFSGLELQTATRPGRKLPLVTSSHDHFSILCHHIRLIFILFCTPWPPGFSTSKADRQHSTALNSPSISLWSWTPARVEPSPRHRPITCCLSLGRLC